MFSTCSLCDECYPLKRAVTLAGLKLITQKERAAHEDYQLIETAFFDLKENAGTRGIKGYLLHENEVRISRRKIGKILSILGLKVKRQKSLKNKAQQQLMIHELCPMS